MGKNEMNELTENMLRLQYESFKKYVNFIELELEILRAKLVKADRLAEQAAITISYAYYMEPAFYLGLESSLKEYRGETK